MLLIFLDTETTGLDPDKHRALEIAFCVVDAGSGRHLVSYESVISQSQEIWAEADPESLKINGFTWEEILDGKSEKAVAAEILENIHGSHITEKTGAFVCQNPSFDRAFFSQIISPDLQARCGWPYHWLDLASMYWAYHLLKEPRTVLQRESDLSKDRIADHFNIPPETSPHRAMNGVRHLMACYDALFSSINSSI